MISANKAAADSKQVTSVAEHATYDANLAGIEAWIVAATKKGEKEIHYPASNLSVEIRNQLIAELTKNGYTAEVYTGSGRTPVAPELHVSWRNATPEVPVVAAPAKKQTTTTSNSPDLP